MFLCLAFLCVIRFLKLMGVEHICIVFKLIIIDVDK